MRRGKFDSEYHRVRRRAATSRYDGKPVEEALGEMYDAEADARIRKMCEEYKGLAAEMNKADAEERAKAKARCDAISKRANQIAALREWQAIGVKPPQVDKDGWPTVTLSLYLSLGWRIVDDGEGGKALVRQLEPDPRERETGINEMGS